MRAHILNIGDEILIGQIINTNAAWLATFLNEFGIFVEEMKTISDNRDEILEAIAASEKVADITFITGGLGPTKDDITKKTLADYFGMGLEFHQPSFDNIVRLFAGMGRVADDRYRVQAHMPIGAQVLINQVGTASGMWFERNGKVWVSMPGVPYEMQYLMREEVMPRVQKAFTLPTLAHHTLQTMGKGETDLSQMLEDFETKILPAHIKLAYLPDTSLGRVRLRLTARGAAGTSAQTLGKELETYIVQMRSILDNLIFGEGDTSIEKELGDLLQKRKATLCTAESCTGGNISKRITGIAGSSSYYMGSVIAYSNAVKTKLLGVDERTLDEWGAVSEQTVREMVKGALQVFKTDYAIAVSGIAGPDGGTKDKPVGTIWVAVGNQFFTYAKKLQLGKDRNRNVELTSSIALNMLRLFVLGKYDF